MGLDTNAPSAIPAPRVPRAYPPGLDFYRFLILAGEASLVAALAVYVAPEWGRLADDPVVSAMWPLGLLGAFAILANDRPWTYLVSGVLVSALPLVALPSFMALQLLDPLGGRSFVGAMLATLGLVLALPAGIRGRRQALAKGHTPIARGWRSRHGMVVVATSCLVSGAVYAGGIASIAASPPTAGATDFTADEIGAADLTLAMEGFEFRPRELLLAAGRVTRLAIENHDDELHTFTYVKDGTEYNHNVFPRANATVWLHFAEPGTVKFRCTPHSDGYDDVEDMVGAMRIVAATT